MRAPLYAFILLAPLAFPNQLLLFYSRIPLFKCLFHAAVEWKTHQKWENSNQVCTLCCQLCKADNILPFHIVSVCFGIWCLISKPRSWRKREELYPRRGICVVTLQTGVRAPWYNGCWELSTWDGRQQAKKRTTELASKKWVPLPQPNACFISEEAFELWLYLSGQCSSCGVEEALPCPPQVRIQLWILSGDIHPSNLMLKSVTSEEWGLFISCWLTQQHILNTR